MVTAVVEMLAIDTSKIAQWKAEKLQRVAKRFTEVLYYACKNQIKRATLFEPV